MNSEMPRRIQARRGFSVLYNNKTLLSTIDPLGRAEKTAKNIQPLPQTLYVVISPLLGYGIDQLQKQIPGSSAVLCLEYDTKLGKLFLEEVTGNIETEQRGYICTNSAVELCCYVRSKWGPRRFRRLSEVCFGAGHSLYEAEYAKLLEALHKDISTDWANALTLSRLGRLYSLNTLRNLPLLYKYRSFEKLFLHNSPVLVCGAGPSLDLTIQKLMELYPETAISEKRIFKIICVDTAVPALKSWGITADLVVVLESQHWNLRDFIGFTANPGSLVMDMTAHSGTARLHADYNYLFCTHWSEDITLLKRIKTLNNKLTELKALGSVGLTAVSIALMATSGPVFISGLDFAYEVDRYHARESPGNLDRLYSSHRLKSPIDPAPAYRSFTRLTESKNKRMIKSDPALQSYRSLFIREFGSLDRIYDIGEFGLSLGIRQLDIQQALEVLNKSKSSCRYRDDRKDTVHGPSKEQITSFIQNELKTALLLRSLLSGEKTLSSAQIEQLLVDCNYLWAHFPEYAATGERKPDLDDLSFLKRVRAELDSFIKAFTIALRDCQDS